MFVTSFIKFVRRPFEAFEITRSFSRAVTLNANAMDRKMVLPNKNLNVFSKEENVEFMEHFPLIVSDLTSNKNYADIPDFTEKFSRLLQYTVPSDIKIRGLTTVIAYKMLEKPDDLTPENMKLANILGWCAEMQESSTIIVDDIIDRSNYRLNAPCWYKLEDVGNLAILEAIILENSLHLLLKKYFSSHPFYVPMVELFTNSHLTNIIGQWLDSTKHELDQITMERFLTIAKYKLSLCWFLTPITLGMYFSKTFSENLHRQVIPIIFEMGSYFQIKNDYSDCFGDIAATGKDGTDIQEGKCSWMAARALQKVNSSQRKIMEEHFGKPEGKSVEAVLALYEELNLPEEFAQYERQSFERIIAQASQIENVQLRNLLQVLIEKLYKRNVFST